MAAITEYFEWLSSKEFHEFLIAHEHDDVQKLLLKGGEVCGIPIKFVVQQITGRQRIKSKLPRWHQNLDLVYPPSLNLEQCSSEATARFKQTALAKFLTGRRHGIDLTGGFGVDTFFLKALVDEMHYVEKDRDLFEIAKNNFKKLGASDTLTHLSSAEDFIVTSKAVYDFIYIDPSRRKDSKKVFRLADCEPSVPALQDVLFSRTDFIILKASPLLDIQQAVHELKNVAEVWVLAVDNECRELVFIMRKGFESEPLIRAINIASADAGVIEIAFKKSEEQATTASFTSPKKFVYEPNAAILKAGAFKWVCDHYKIAKLAPSTHLYSSDSKIDFPGRTFEILETVRLDKKLKERFNEGYANILTRNYPLSVEEVKKKSGLKEGGEQYLICTQDQKEKLVLIARRLV